MAIVDYQLFGGNSEPSLPAYIPPNTRTLWYYFRDRQWTENGLLRWANTIDARAFGLPGAAGMARAVLTATTLSDRAVVTSLFTFAAALDVTPFYGA